MSALRFGKILTYRDLDKAEKLLGKKVVFSNSLADIEDKRFCQEKSTLPASFLRTISDDGSNHPFGLIYYGYYSFIREVFDDEKPDLSEYSPYDFNNPETRKSLRGRWYRDKSGNELLVSGFYPLSIDGSFQLNNGLDAEEFLQECVWLDDGKPCGVKDN